MEGKIFKRKLKLFSTDPHDGTDAYLRLLKFKNLLKNNIIVIIAVLGAIITCFFVPPDKEYLNYVSYKTILCLLSLMLVVRGLKDCRFFGIMSGKILDKISDRRAIATVLIFLPAFFALFITNDIATITFIPFAIIMLSQAEANDLIPFVVIMQTMAVKLSGIVSPLGNAQNLFLIDYYDFDFFWFVKNLWPLALAGYGLTFIMCLFVKKGKLNPPPVGEYKLPKFELLIYFVMFVFIILSIFDVLPYYIVTPIILVVMLFVHPRSYKKANYGVIIMFTAFFVMSGNFLRMPSVNGFLTKIIAGNELWLSALASQLLTNNPVALVFPTFSKNTVSLMYGINIGKYGTAPLNNYMVMSLERKYDVKKHFVLKLLAVNFLYFLVLFGVAALVVYL